MTAGVLGLVMPSVLGSGNDLIVSLTGGEMLLGGLIVTFVVKFLFSAVSFGSGAPGGIFFPLLILGAPDRRHLLHDRGQLSSVWTRCI